MVDTPQRGAAVVPVPEDALTALIGVQRSAIVRYLEDAPARCGRIAEALHLVPGGVTHHLRALETAGLITRKRKGRHVLVELTARGRALRVLFEHAPEAICAARCEPCAAPAFRTSYRVE